MSRSRGALGSVRVFVLRWLLCALPWLLPLAVSGHQGDATGFAAITVSGHMVRYSLTLSALPDVPFTQQMRPSAPGSAPDNTPLLRAIATHVHISADGVRCQAGPGQVLPPAAGVISVTTLVDFVCSRRVSELAIRDQLYQLLGADLHTLARIESDGGVQQFAFSAESPEARFTVAVPVPASRGAGSFVLLGVEHILSGYDHLLFLLALVLCGGSLRQLLLIITAFTLAHSVTLALAVTDMVVLPSRLVESLIALSIAYVAAENLFPRMAVSRRWAISFVFGLVHGFGFSSVIREMGLPHDNLLLSLLGFNAGVELGQAAVLLLVVPVIAWSMRERARSPLQVPVSGFILAVGLVLFVERAFVAA